MSTTAIQAQAAHQPAAEASHKRKREEAADAKVVERTHGFDLDILGCSSCMKPFSPGVPVYQCHYGHTACLACCKKLTADRKCPQCLNSTGGIRCRAIEKLVESLLVSCKYARHGCEQMQRPSSIRNHEAHCEYEPFRCPVPECNYQASRTPLLWHLTEVHHVPTMTPTIMAQNSNCNTVHFTMGPSNRLVMVNVDVEKTRVIYLVHLEVHEHLGDIFFCTSFGFEMEEYNLQVKFKGDSVTHSMQSARAIGLRCMTEYLKKDFLLVPAKKTSLEDHFDVDFSAADRKILRAPTGSFKNIAR